MDEEKKREPTVVVAGRIRTNPQPGGIGWELMSDGRHRYWLVFYSVSGAMLRLAVEPMKEGLKPADL